MPLWASFIQFPGGSEWLIIFLIILIVFGPKNLPKIGHAIGKGIREFKEASEGIQRAIEEEAPSENYSEDEEDEKDESPDSSDHSD